MCDCGVRVRAAPERAPRSAQVAPGDPGQAVHFSRLRLFPRHVTALKFKKHTLCAHPSTLVLYIIRIARGALQHPYFKLPFGLAPLPSTPTPHPAFTRAAPPPVRKPETIQSRNAKGCSPTHLTPTSLLPPTPPTRLALRRRPAPRSHASIVQGCMAPT